MQAFENCAVSSQSNNYISFVGWYSGGIGKSNGFEQVKILLVAHGGNHNDTICTVEIKK